MKTLKLFSLLLVVTMIVTACGGAAAPAAAPTQAAAQPAAAKTIKIYASWPLQGSMIPEGTAMLNATKLGLDEAKNEAAGYKLELVFLDDASPTTGSWDGTIES